METFQTNILRNKNDNSIFAWYTCRNSFRQQTTILKPLGRLLIHLLSLIAIPVIFLTVVLAVTK